MKRSTRKTQPRSGQFARIWLFNGKLWSETAKVDEETGALMVYESESDQWIPAPQLAEECYETMRFIEA